ncbi:hypothetical protein [Paractinoplanes lichenicola]|uniref:Uncharacterized protein n=1 Tax=Paractinoplanes lichenicola TaxID=2802976 RepID=A0ABS1W5Q1_9ACTN|nr:hypothetical protein [Actinoplanes lichenicola]MBL7262013.1 hypothetical protein [Actinoplanes lichenicola]
MNSLRALTVATAAVLFALPATAASAAPTAPTLTVGGVACAPGGILVGSPTPAITARFTGSGTLTPSFAVWPAGRPAQRVEWTAPELSRPGTAFTTLPSAVVDGGKYRLTAHGASCTFTVDTVRPKAPLVTSADYPRGQSAGGAGVAGKFTFAADGDRDVVKFRYSAPGAGLVEVPADRRGRATVTITPDSYGAKAVTVQAIDRTGNRSAETTYEFTVIDNEPRVYDDNPSAAIGEPRVIRFWSAVPGTQSFTYTFNGGPAVTVPADAQGYGHATVTPGRRGDNPMTVTSRTGNGVVSPEITFNVYVRVEVPVPQISSPDFPGDGTPPPTVGETVTIVLRTDSPEVAEFVVSLDFGQTEQVVAADADGNVTFQHTLPPDYIFLEVQARARTADGFESGSGYAGWELTPADG